MPCEFRIETGVRMVFSRGFGVVTEEDLLNHRRALTGDPDFDPTFYQLIDFMDATALRVSPTFLQSFAAQRVFAPEARRAIVVPDDAIYGNARAFVAWLVQTPSNIRIFRDMGEARQWLGLG